jgi:hypothetical protein
MDERRRSARRDVSIPAVLHLSGGRGVPVAIRNVGELGVLVEIGELEVAVAEGERALLEHLRIVDEEAVGPLVKTPAAVVRVDLDVEEKAIVRHVALYFDGGPSPGP